MTLVAKLLIVDPGIEVSEDQCAAEVLRGWAGDHEILRPALVPSDLERLTMVDDFDGAVLLGSHASVYDDRPWLAPLGTWVDSFLLGDRREPLLAICFGHQLVAHRAGARIDYLRSDQAMDTAVVDTTLEGGRLLPGRHRLRVLAIQKWEVKQLPRGFRATAHRPDLPYDGLEHVSRAVFTFQFHPEGRQDLAASCGGDPGAIDVRLAEHGQRLLSAFRALL